MVGWIEIRSEIATKNSIWQIRRTLLQWQVKLETTL